MQVRTIKSSSSLHLYIDNKGVMPGRAKLTLFQKALALRCPPRIGSQVTEDRDNMTAHVRIVDPCGGRNWYVLEWDRDTSVWALFLGEEKEFIHADLDNLARDPGAFDKGLEIDLSFKPTKVSRL